MIKNTEFINFDDTSACYGGTQIDGHTESHNGGFTYEVTNNVFTNSPNRIAFRWLHDAAYRATDDSLTSTSGGVVVPCAGFLPTSCVQDDLFTLNGIDGCRCPADVEFHRFAFNNYAPPSLEGKDVEFTNTETGGSAVALFKKKRVEHPFGWMALLPSKKEIKMEFLDAGHIINISYTGVMYDFEVCFKNTPSPKTNYYSHTSKRHV